MAERSHIFDDLAGVAGGAFSALSGIRDETEALFRARLDELIRRFDLAGRADLDAVKELAANARGASEDCLTRLASLDQRLGELERRLAALEAPPSPPPDRAGPEGP